MLSGPLRVILVFATAIITLTILHTFELSYDFTPKEKLAYVTFLSPNKAELKPGQLEPEDVYFTATRVLAWQFMHDPITKTQRDIPFIVMVNHNVSEWKRERLRMDGAEVREIGAIQPSKGVAPGEPRWWDQFSKLRLWTLTDFDRILYLDSDMLLMRTLDAIWEDPAATPVAHPVSEDATDEDALPKQYLFAAFWDSMGPGHNWPPDPNENLNAGFFMIKPDLDMYRYLRHVMLAPDLYNKQGMMEQSLLNWVFSKKGPMPWQALKPIWTTNWPNIKDAKAGMATLHDNFWTGKASGNSIVKPDQDLSNWWYEKKGLMEGYYLLKDKMTFADQQPLLQKKSERKQMELDMKSAHL